MNIFKFNFRSLVLNFKLFPLNIALKLPLLVHRSVKIKHMHRGCIELHNVYPGMIQMGFSDNAILDPRRDRTVISIEGKMVVKGKLFLGQGCRISFNKDSQVCFGKNCLFNGNTTIISNKKIEFGDNVLFSWDCSIMDTDFHQIMYGDKRINQDKDIILGNNIWVGTGCTILKGSIIPDGCVIGARSLVNKNLLEKDSIYAGNPVHLIRKDIIWKM